MRKKLYILIIIVAVVLAAAIFGYCKWVSPTKIAFVNYQAAALGKYHKLNNNSWIKVKEVSVEDLSKLSGYDMVFVNGLNSVKLPRREYLYTPLWLQIPIMIFVTSTRQQYP